MASPAVTERPPRDASATRLVVGGVWITALVAAVVFYVAYDDATYDLASRNSLAIGIWWTLLVAVGLGVWPLGRISRAALVPGALLGLFALWTLASTAWAASAENAFAEFDRTALYAGIYTLVVVAVARRDLRRWLDGLALAIVAVCVVALISRFFPGSFPQRGLPASIPNAATRLAFPLDYWNGLGIFLGLGVPLLLATALAPDRIRRALAVASVPLVAAAVFLTSSRGAVVALAVGVIVFLLGEQRRVAALVASAIAAAGSATAVGVLAVQTALVNGPLGSAAAHADGWHAALYVLAICIATGLVFDGAAELSPRLPVPPRPVALGLVSLVLAAVLAAIAASHPIRRFDHFTRIPVAVATSGGTSHLLSGGGSGRWQFWSAAVHEFQSAPLGGRGAGSYEAWWAQHASFPYFVVNAHSLYLQTLGELGVVGFVLLAGALVTGVVVAVKRLLRARGVERTAVAGLLGALAAYLVGAGIDWMWELTAVTVVAVACLALLCGPATVTPVAAASLREERPGRRFGAVVAVAVAAWALVCAEAIPLLADVEVRASQADVRGSRATSALKHATDATKIEPWAATPYLQLALVQEAASNLPAARRAIDAALHRDGRDWRLWLVAARIQTEQGETGLGARSLERARALNPRSPLFARAQ